MGGSTRGSDMSEATPRRPGEQSEESVNPISEADGVTLKDAKPGPSVQGPSDPTDLTEVYAQGLQIETRSQWQLARRRFLRHKLAMTSLIVLLLIFGVAIFADQLTT